MEQERDEVWISQVIHRDEGKGNMHVRFLRLLIFLAVPLLIRGENIRSPKVPGPTNTHFTLKRAIEAALENSPALRESRLNVEIADEQVREAWSNVLPRLTSNASYSRSIIEQSIFLPAQFFDTTASPGEQRAVKVGADNVWGAGVTLSQPLFHMGAFVGIGAAGRVQQLQAELLRGSTQQVVTRVRQAYLNALLSREQVQLIEKSLQRVHRSLEEAQALNRTGMVSDYDVLRLEVQVANLESDFHQAETSRDAAHRNLLVEVGLSPNLNITLEGRLNELDLLANAGNTRDNLLLLDQVGFAGDTTAEFQDVYQTALENRSDLRQMELSIALEETRLAAQRADYFPSLSLFYNYNLAAQENEAPDFFGENARQRTEFAVAGINLEVPIFSGFARNARMERQRVVVRQGKIRREQLKHRAESRLRTLLSNLKDARYRAARQRKALSQAQRGYEIAAAQYRTGVGSQLQVTDAEVALRQSEFNYARAVFDFLTVKTQLDAAVGTVPVSLSELEHSATGIH